MREDLIQNIAQEQPNPIQKERQNRIDNHTTDNSVNVNKLSLLSKYLKSPNFLVLFTLFFILFSLFILSLFVNNKTPPKPNLTIIPTSIPLNKPTNIPQIPEKYKDKFDTIDQEIQNIQVELPPLIDENIGQ